MDCRQCAEDLTAFLDGELSEASSGQVQSHLQTCTSCSEELRSLQEAAEFIESHNRRLDPRAGSWNMVRARIRMEKASSPSHSWLSNRWRLAVAALALVAAFATGYMQYQQTQKRDLDRYLSEYMQQRQILVNSQTVNDPNDDNPFIEIKEIQGPVNPFRSEDR